MYVNFVQFVSIVVYSYKPSNKLNKRQKKWHETNSKQNEEKNKAKQGNEISIWNNASAGIEPVNQLLSFHDNKIPNVRYTKWSDILSKQLLDILTQI